MIINFFNSFTANVPGSASANKLSEFWQCFQSEKGGSCQGSFPQWVLSPVEWTVMGKMQQPSFKKWGRSIKNEITKRSRNGSPGEVWTDRDFILLCQVQKLSCANFMSLYRLHFGSCVHICSSSHALWPKFVGFHSANAPTRRFWWTLGCSSITPSHKRCPVVESFRTLAIFFGVGKAEHISSRFIFDR